MNRTRSGLTALAVATLLLLAGAVAPATAQDSADEDGESSIVASVEERIDQLISGIVGGADRLDAGLLHNPIVDAIRGSGPTTASEIVDELDAFAQDRGPAIAEYANAHLSEDTEPADYDVLQLHLESGGEQETIYAVATVEDGEIMEVDVADSTDRQIDWTLEFDEKSTRELPSDVEWVYEDYVSEDEPIDSAARARITTKYGGNVNVSSGDAPRFNT